tara:strand:- start:2806 stop:2979 length:174 start_codon:yes stop_codon:yes gene_type:complete
MYTKKKGWEVSTPYPTKRNKIEIWLDKYNHIMEFIRTLLAVTTVLLQLYIITKLTGG